MTPREPRPSETILELRELLEERRRREGAIGAYIGALGSRLTAIEDPPRGRGTPDFDRCCLYHRTGGAPDIGCMDELGPWVCRGSSIPYELTDKARRYLERRERRLEEDELRPATRILSDALGPDAGTEALKVLPEAARRATKRGAG